MINNKAETDRLNRDPNRAGDFSTRDVPHLKFRTRIFLLLGNLIPLFQLIVSFFLPCTFASDLLSYIVGVLACVFFIPPLGARLLTRFFPLRSGNLSLSEPAFLAWWITFQLQVLFTRLPFLEETMRLIPSLYSFWLRLWGARIGRLTYWSPGVTILDRSLLTIGDDVVLGAGVTLVSHLYCQADPKQLELIVAPIRIEDRAIVGGYSIIGPGAEIGSGECTEACCILPPFRQYRGGNRLRPTRMSMKREASAK